MNPIPLNITNFINRHHVVSLACQANGTLWSASCFYLFEPEKHRLIVLTKRTTLHGELMLANPTVAGTIAGQPEQLHDIEGIQFLASARCLTANAEKNSELSAYYQRHPVAKLIPSDVWEIRFEQIKHTENRLTFAHKTYWQAEQKERLDSALSFTRDKHEIDDK